MDHLKKEIPDEAKAEAVLMALLEFLKSLQAYNDEAMNLKETDYEKNVPIPTKRQLNKYKLERALQEGVLIKVGSSGLAAAEEVERGNYLPINRILQLFKILCEARKMNDQYLRMDVQHAVAATHGIDYDGLLGNVFEASLASSVAEDAGELKKSRTLRAITILLERKLKPIDTEVEAILAKMRSDKGLTPTLLDLERNFHFKDEDVNKFEATLKELGIFIPEPDVVRGELKS